MRRFLMLPVHAVAGMVESFSPKRLPQHLQVNYARELLSWCFLPFMLGAMEGGALGVVVNKGFSGVEGVDQATLDIAVAAVTAAPNVANLCSFLWAAWAHGRPKVPFIARLQVATALGVAAIAFVPVTAIGLWMVVALTFLSRCCWTGVITIRTSVWRRNFPRANRAQIAGKMATVQAAILAVAGLAIGQSMDMDARSYHVLFPALAALGLVGNALYRRVHLLNEESIVREEREAKEHERPSVNPAALLRVLRDDPDYRLFMIGMFIFGMGNLMITPPQILFLEQEFGASYLESILATTIIPLAVMPIAIPLWARYMARVHAAQFRAVHGWSFVCATAMMLASALAGSLAGFYVASVLLGIGFGGGVLAWNLGHQDFAPKHRDAEYMAVHVTNNGVRALIAPFLIIFIYQSLDDALGIEGAAWSFAACFIVNLAGMGVFLFLARRMRHAALLHASPHD
ncbi:MAG: MFS transporter [Planctomycetota bacterium]|nr:MFS transporter [Planctomycetota bacterium]MDA1105176.1 MFS transporter [Planctomycetota bacterium]